MTSTQEQQAAMGKEPINLRVFNRLPTGPEALAAVSVACADILEEVEMVGSDLMKPLAHQILMAIAGRAGKYTQDIVNGNVTPAKLVEEIEQWTADFSYQGPAVPTAADHPNNQQETAEGAVNV